jgi:hypothetical protein
MLMELYVKEAYGAEHQRANETFDCIYVQFRMSEQLANEAKLSGIYST